MSPYLSVIVPAYNEEKRITATLAALVAYGRKRRELTSRDFEILVVDDGSGDKTVPLVQNLAWPEVKVIEQEHGGKGAAVKAGMLKARGEVRLFTDADNSTPVTELDKLWPYLDSGVPVVIGSRAVKGSRVVVAQSWARRTLGQSANILIQGLLVPGIKDTQCGFKAFNQEAAQRLFSLQTLSGWGFDFEILALARRLGLPIVEVGVSWYNSQESRVQPVASIFKTLSELFRIRLNLWLGRYKEKL